MKKRKNRYSFSHIEDHLYHLFFDDSLLLCLRVVNATSITIDQALTAKFIKRVEKGETLDKLDTFLDPETCTTVRHQWTCKMGSARFVVDKLMNEKLNQLVEHYTNVYIAKLIVE